VIVLEGAFGGWSNVVVGPYALAIDKRDLRPGYLLPITKQGNHTVIDHFQTARVIVIPP
jgi:hypothetical protein